MSLPKIVFRQQVTSTQDEILELAHNDELLLVANQQTAGRGRWRREWDSPRGNYYASFLALIKDGESPHFMPFLAALAMYSSIRVLSAPARLRRILFKWPNDLLLDGRKLAGFMGELKDKQMVLGMGLNFVSSPAAGTAWRATSWRDAFGESAPDHMRLAKLWLATFMRLRQGNIDLHAALSARLFAPDKSVLITSDQGERLSGRIIGLADDLRLRVRLDDGSDTLLHGGNIQQCN